MSKTENGTSLWAVMRMVMALAMVQIFMMPVKILAAEEGLEEAGGEETEVLEALEGAGEETAGTDSGEVRFKYAVADENKIKAYIRGAETEGSVSYQIGSIPVGAIEAYGIAEDRNPMRTLIMLDNSLSVPGSSRDRIKEVIQGIVDAHSEKETFRLATFSDQVSYLSDAYSNDYTALKNMAGSVTYVDQETYLTDVLYDVIDDLNKDVYMGYTRIIIISDGVDNKQLGVTREELNTKLKDSQYPVYTIGTLTGKNYDQLENMFALSRLSGSEYCILEETENADIISGCSRDADIAVFEAIIPDDAKAGGRQSSRLILPGGAQVVFEVNMPFQARGKEEEPRQAAPVPEETDTKQEEAPAGTEEDETGGMAPVVLAAAGILVVLALAGVIAVLLIRKKKKVPERPEGTVPTGTVISSETQLVEEGNGSGILPPPGQLNRTKYRVTFSDKQDMSRTYQCELKNSISLGRAEGNDIVINSGTVSKKHCMITNKNGRFFIQDLNSANGTFVNQERVNYDREIFSGTTIKLAKTELLVKFDQV